MKATIQIIDAVFRSVRELHIDYIERNIPNNATTDLALRITYMRGGSVNNGIDLVLTRTYSVTVPFRFGPIH